MIIRYLQYKITFVIFSNSKKKEKKKSGQRPLQNVDCIMGREFWADSIRRIRWRGRGGRFVRGAAAAARCLPPILGPNPSFFFLLFSLFFFSLSPPVVPRRKITRDSHGERVRVHASARARRPRPGIYGRAEWLITPSRRHRGYSTHTHTHVYKLHIHV